MRFKPQLRTLFMVAAVLLALAPFGTAAYEADDEFDAAPSATTGNRENHLSVLTDRDLRQILQERGVKGVESGAPRHVLEQLVMTTEEDQGVDVDVQVGGASYARHTIRFEYCVGWGYRNLFVDIANKFQHKYPGVQVSGENYPPGAVKQMIGQFFQLMMLLGVVANIVPSLFGADVAAWIQENRGMAIGFIFVMNMIVSSAMQTGAFEVYVDDTLVFSKLKTGYAPNFHVLLQKIDPLLSSR